MIVDVCCLPTGATGGQYARDHFSGKPTCFLPSLTDSRELLGASLQSGLFNVVFSRSGNSKVGYVAKPNARRQALARVVLSR